MVASHEPHARGMLDVGDGQRVCWECSGEPTGRPAVFLHGGPGGGLGAGYRRWFDPTRYRVVGLDQRGCGRSRPLATDDLSGLAANTTGHLVRDLEALREHLGIERWLVVGVSWGTTLALAYAQAHPRRVDALALMATTLTDAAAVEWITETVGALFPREWDDFRASAGARPGQRLVDAYFARLTDPDPAVRERAALDWERWERAHISLDPHPIGPLTTDPVRRRVFATLVTHYWRNAAFLPDGALLAGMSELRGIPGILVQGRLDVSGPAATAWRLHRAWPGSRFVLVDDEGHGGEAMVAAMREFIAQVS